MIPQEISLDIENELHCTITSFTSIGGGCINNGGRLTTSTGDFFLKWNFAKEYPNMLSLEARGLDLLYRHSVIRIPKVILTKRLERYQYIVLEFIPPSTKGKNYWQELGRGLAQMHRVSHTHFGLDHDNYIGSLPQKNTYQESWRQFFINQRLVPQLKLATDNKLINAKLSRNFEVLFYKIDQMLPDSKPSLIHGDLWSGNVIVDEKGKPCLIDPAAYYGNREIEIAFTKLFGGFSPEFYQSYHEGFPLEKGFNERVDLYNLYPLLIHINLFGESYLDQVVSILSRHV